MAFLGLFLTTAEKAAKDRERKRMCERGIEKNIENLANAEKMAAAEQEKYYQEGKKLLSVGRTAEARISFENARMQMMEQQNNARNRLLWRHALTQVKSAASMQMASLCFQELVKSSGLQIGKIDRALDSMDAVQDFMADVNKAFGAQWTQQITAAGGAGMSDTNPEVEAMMAQAEREIAAEIGGVSSTMNSTSFSQR